MTILFAPGGGVGTKACFLAAKISSSLFAPIFSSKLTDFLSELSRESIATIVNNIIFKSRMSD